MGRRRTPDQPLVRLAIAQSEIEARMWEDILREHGITALVKNRDAVSTAYGSSPLLPYSYELFVLAEDETQARSLLGL